MKVECIHEGGDTFYRAQGNGPLQYIIVEHTDRKEAVAEYSHLFAKQCADGEAMMAASIYLTEN